MRKPNLEEFYDETTDTYDYEEYESVLGDYADEQRDFEFDMADQIHEQRKDEKDD